MSFSDLRRGEDGFTLVELLCAMGVSVLVLLATLQSFDVFATHASHQTRVTDANDQVRSVMDRTVRDLRGASKILRASASDLAYAVPDSAGARMERLCVSGNRVYGSSSVTSGTPAAPTTLCSTGTKIATLDSNSSTAFTYDGATSSATPATVKNVGLTFGLETSGGGKVASSTLKASAARRSSGTLPITPPDIDATCNSSGALLSLGVSLADYGPLTVTYASTGGISLGTPSGNTLQIPEGVTTVVATVTDGLGLTKTITKDVECS